MDLMRTLLVYMSATLTLAVQSTAAPKETPTPSPISTETAIVETVKTAETGSDTITAAPKADEKEKITPFPVPTITPNVKGYHNLTMGTKGKEVKKLQEKLIDLKYLPDDSADGAYGRQTYNAVKKFQYYNGLKADGIAGRATQTNLFENDHHVLTPVYIDARKSEKDHFSVVGEFYIKEMHYHGGNFAGTQYSINGRAWEYDIGQKMSGKSGQD